MSIPEPKKYIADFEKMGMGMFVHFGLYSQLGRGEWMYSLHEHSDEEYQGLTRTFTANDFDAENLVNTAKNAGCKYIVFTTRHHDGFSLYDTCGLNDFDAPHSAAGRDLVREYVDACRKYDIIPFFYHTLIDWYNMDYEKDFDEYLVYLRKSVEILCKNYGKIGGFWFDGVWDKRDADWKEDELYKTIRKYQPEAIIVNNTGVHRRGQIGNPEIDSVTFEQGTPTPMNREGMEKYIAAEMCQTLNDHWGIGEYDFNYKSPKELIENLCNSRKVGANFLINIGPTAQGGVHFFQEGMLKIIGMWMSLYGEAIYNGKPYEAGGMGKNFILKGENALYLFFFDLARHGSENVTVNENNSFCGSYAFGNVKEKIDEIEWMDTHEKLEFLQNENMLSINATGIPYGMSTCVRVAKAKIK